MHTPLDPSELHPSTLYDLLTAAIQPRPIVLVGTCTPSGEPNLAPFSFVTVGGVRPPSLVFCPVLNAAGEPKETLKNIQDTGEFSVCSVDRRLADIILNSKPEPGVDIDWPYPEFSQAACERIAPPRVAESPVALECRLHEIVQHGDGPGSAVYVIGEVVRMHLSPEVYHEGKAWPTALRLVARLGGPEYLDASVPEVFTPLPHPHAKPAT